MKTLTIIICLLGANLAHAGVIHQYTFEVTAVNGPLEGTTGVGTFTYDDQGQGGKRLLGLVFDSFHFDWNGQIWDEKDVMFGSVWLDQDGKIDFNQISTFLGSSCIVGQCGVSANTLEWNLEILGMDHPTYGGEIFRYATLEDGGFGVANGKVDIQYQGQGAAVSVPEPGTLALFGLTALLALRRRYG